MLHCTLNRIDNHLEINYTAELHNFYIYLYGKKIMIYSHMKCYKTLNNYYSNSSTHARTWHCSFCNSFFFPTLKAFIVCCNWIKEMIVSNLLVGLRFLVSGNSSLNDFVDDYEIGRINMKNTHQTNNVLSRYIGISISDACWKINRFDFEVKIALLIWQSDHFSLNRQYELNKHVLMLVNCFFKLISLLTEF